MATREELVARIAKMLARSLRTSDPGPQAAAEFLYRQLQDLNEEENAPMRNESYPPAHHARPSVTPGDGRKYMQANYEKYLKEKEEEKRSGAVGPVLRELNRLFTAEGELKKEENRRIGIEP